MVDRAIWQPLLLADLRAGGRYHAAVDRSGATLSRVRREIVRDRWRDDLPVGERLGELIEAAKREGEKANARLNAATSARRFAKLSATYDSPEARARRGEHGRKGAAVRAARAAGRSAR